MYLQTPNNQLDRSRRPINRVGTRKKMNPMAFTNFLLACIFAILLSTGCKPKPKWQQHLRIENWPVNELSGQAREPEISLTID